MILHSMRIGVEISLNAQMLSKVPGRYQSCLTILQYFILIIGIFIGLFGVKTENLFENITQKITIVVFIIFYKYVD
jgi:hypothetical protein